jgi:hypothetical protein
MNRKILLKLIICDAVLALLMLGYSWLCPFGTRWSDELYRSHWAVALYQLIYGQMVAPVALVLLTSAFTWVTFRASSPCKRWQLVMTVNALICMVAGSGVFVIIFACGGSAPWFSLTFSRMVFWTGLMAIVLSFPLKLLRRKGLVA